MSLSLKCLSIKPFSLHALLCLSALVLFSGCSLLPSAPPSSTPPSTKPPEASAPAPSKQTTRLDPEQILQAAQFADLPGWADDDLRASWPGFLLSCKAMSSRPWGKAWQRVCALAQSINGQDSAAVRAFYETHLSPYALINPETQSFDGLITGYYEPLLRGSRQQGGVYQTPVLGVPSDLLTIDLGDVLPELKNMRLRGRLEGNKVLPYASRSDIVGQTGFRKGKDTVLLWVDDPIELFFLQIQGSGRVMLPDGSTVRLGYADQNGHPYRSIGRVLIDQGELKAEEASMQGIQNWARKNPRKLNALLNSNPSYVFFRELPASGNPEEGPPGALGVPLSPERSIAIDPKTTPLGVPVFLSTTRPNTNIPLNRLMLAQDTGGAIRGVIRGDFFWGFGHSAGEQAGRMKQSGRMWLLLPPEAAPRLRQAAPP